MKNCHGSAARVTLVSRVLETFLVCAKVRSNRAALCDLGAQLTFGRNPQVIYKKQTNKHGCLDNQLSLGRVISVELRLQLDVG